MPSSPSLSPSDPPPQTTAARLNLTALHDTLTRIGQANTDPGLRPLIAESLARCTQLEQYFDRHLARTTSNQGIIDMQVFERLMLLAGPETARDLLDQLLADLGTAQTALITAAPQQDWRVLRAQCHVLIAVAGSIGASSLQHEAERLQAAAYGSDSSGCTHMLPSLLARLTALISFVEGERLSRVVP
jgi:HPt (histidine-containing phosphotransfer) domain-containing protein